MPEVEYLERMPDQEKKLPKLLGIELPPEVIASFLSFLPIKSIAAARHVFSLPDRQLDPSRSNIIWKDRVKRFFPAQFSDLNQNENIEYYLLFKHLFLSAFGHLSAQDKKSVFEVLEEDTKTVLDKSLRLLWKRGNEYEYRDQQSLLYLLSSSHNVEFLDLLIRRNDVELQKELDNVINTAHLIQATYPLMQNGYGSSLPHSNTLLRSIPRHYWKIVFQYPWKQLEKDFDFRANVLDASPIGEAIEIAARFNPEVMNQIFAHRGDSLSDESIEKAFIAAVKYGDIARVKSVLTFACDHYKSLAEDSEDDKIAKFINVVADGYGETALMFAARAGNLALIEFLLDKGASPYTTQVNERTALTYAIFCHQNEAAKLILNSARDKDALINQESYLYCSKMEVNHAIGGFSTLLVAAYVNNRAGYQLLLEARATLGDIERRSLALHAILKSRSIHKLGTLKAIFEAEGKDSILSSMEPENARMVLVSAIQKNDLAKVKFLLDNGCKGFISNCKWVEENALFLAIRSGYSNIVRVLLDAGAPIEQLIDHLDGGYFRSVNALQLALISNQKSSMQVILEHMKTQPSSKQIQILDSVYSHSKDRERLLNHLKDPKLLLLFMEVISDLPMGSFLKYFKPVDRASYYNEWVVETANHAPLALATILSSALHTQNFSLSHGILSYLKAGEPELLNRVLPSVQLKQDVVNNISFLTMRARIANFPGGKLGFAFASLLVIPLMVLPIYWFYKNWSEKNKLNTMVQEISNRPLSKLANSPSSFFNARSNRFKKAEQSDHAVGKERIADLKAKSLEFETTNYGPLRP